MNKAARNPKPPNAQWWTVEQFGEITYRSAAAVRTSIARGDLPAVKIGKRWFIDSRYFQARFDAAAKALENRDADE